MNQLMGEGRLRKSKMTTPNWPKEIKPQTTDPSKIDAFCAQNRPVHALSGIMGNQGKMKVAKKQSGKIYVYLHISILRFIFERKLIL